MSKVWNVVGSFFGLSSILPDGSELESLLTITKLSKTNYYSGEKYSPELTRFKATFRTPDDETVEIDIPSKLVEPDDWNPDIPFTNTGEVESRLILKFKYTYNDVTKNTNLEIVIWPTKFTLEDIKVIVPPNKTVYYDGEYFDHKGMVVSATSVEGDEKEIPYCGQSSCSSGRDCYYYPKTPLSSNEQEEVNIEFTYCIPNDFENINKTATFTYPVTVYLNEKKAVLRITYDSDATKTQYYSGSKFNSTGIKVEAKYPREEDTKYKDVTSLCTIEVEGFPNGILLYTEDNLGDLNIKVSYLDSDTGLTSEDYLKNVIKVYEVDRLEPDTSGLSGKTFRVGDTFNKKDMPVTVIYKPSSIPSIVVTNYNIKSNDYIDSNGKFLKVKSDAAISFTYTDVNDPNKKTHIFEQIFNIEKKLVVATKPTNLNPSFKDNGNGYLFLKYIGITSSSGSSTLKEGIGKVNVNGLNLTSNIGNTFYNNGEDSYRFSVEVFLLEDTDAIHYEWDDKTTNSIALNVTLILQVSLSVSPSSVSFDYSTGDTSSKNVSVNASPSKFDISSVSFTTSISSGSSYFSVSGNNENYSITPKSDDSLDGLKTGSLRINYDAGYSRWFEITNSSSYLTVSVRVTYEKKWEWGSESELMTTTWINDLLDAISKSKVNLDAEMGKKKKVSTTYGTKNVMFVHYDTSSLTFGFLDSTGSGPFNGTNNVSGTDYLWGKGYCEILKNADTVYNSISFKSKIISTTKKFTMYNGSTTSSTVSASYSMKLWPPSFTELGISNYEDGKIVCPQNSGDTRFYEGRYSDSINTSKYYIRNGSYWDGLSGDSGGSYNKKIICYLNGSTLTRVNDKTSAAQFLYCFKISKS